MAKSTKDLKKTGKNPRIVTDNSLEKLNDNLVTFGDLGGVVYNTLLGELVSANQRTSLFNLKKNRIEYTEQLKTPTEDGTTAYGYIIIDNQKFSYREVKWEEEKHKAAVLLANTHAGQFDFSMLETEFADIDFEGLGMDDLKADLDRFVLGDLEDAEGTEGDNTKSTYEAEEDDFEVPEIEEIKTDIVVGDLFEIGRHRLLCGDSTDKETVERLMNGEKADMVFTDPPYGINYSGGRSQVVATKSYGKLINDDLKDEELGNLIVNVFDFNKEDADVYICLSPKIMKPFLDFIENKGKTIDAVIVWDKKQPGLGYMAYRRQCEFILFIKGGAFHKGDNSDFDLWSISRDNGQDYQHGTQKPIKVPARGINNSSKENDLVLDYFGGSGSTMVASEQLNRKAYLMELDPKYCEVIVQRMRKLDPSVKITKNGIEI